MEDRIQETLSQVKYVAATADAWSVGTERYVRVYAPADYPAPDTFDFTADEMRLALIAIAGLRNEHASLVQGFVRASTFSAQVYHGFQGTRPNNRTPYVYVRQDPDDSDDEDEDEQNVAVENEAQEVNPAHVVLPGVGAIDPRVDDEWQAFVLFRSLQNSPVIAIVRRQVVPEAELNAGLDTLRAMLVQEVNTAVAAARQAADPANPNPPPPLVAGTPGAALGAQQQPQVVVENHWYLPTLERAWALNWPNPRDFNPIWRWLGVTPPEMYDSIFRDEVSVLEGTSMRDLARILLSLGGCCQLASG
ncbi:hypothetical protein Ciccas_010263 [Cichlidogyrus casuarinus]|uniref:Uncharacterized protein n=1 Tax=Cichlidogyrus casuarinus TaxID=1844966 RepID=A0ABD2PUN0_9PLAT